VSYRAVKEGFITEDKICGNLGDVVAGLKEGRKFDEEIIFFNPIGLGIHDLSEAYRVFQSAKEKGIGRIIPLWKDPQEWLNNLKV